ncbi:reverse transcriptase domain-containing protein [Tanacetum coccineum]
MNEQSHYKQDQTKTRQSINVKSHIFNVREDNDKSKQTPTRMSSVVAFCGEDKEVQLASDIQGTFHSRETQLSRSRCMYSLKEIKSLFKFLSETLQDYGTMPIFKRTFFQDLDLLEQHLTKDILSRTDCTTTLTNLRTKFENAFNLEFEERMRKYTRYNAQSFNDANCSLVGEMTEIALTSGATKGSTGAMGILEGTTRITGILCMRTRSQARNRNRRQQQLTTVIVEEPEFPMATMFHGSNALLQAPLVGIREEQFSPYQAPTPQIQGVSKTDFENYVKANDAVLKNVQNQAITTRSGKTLEEPSTPLVPTPVVPIPSKEPEQNPETSMDKVKKPSLENTAQVPPPEEEDSIFMEIPKPKAKKTVNIEIHEPNSPKPTSYQPKLPYPERIKVRENDKPSAQHSRFLKMFKQLHLELGLKDALVEMPKFNKWLSSLLRNKKKLEEITITTVNAECSAIIMNKVLEKLEDPRKFLIPCALQELDRTNSLADSRASINLLPYSIYKQLGLGALTPTRMTLELANRSITYPIGIAEDVVVRVDGFTFLADFVVVNFEPDPRVPIILGRPFLRTAKSLIDLYEEKLTLRVGSDALVFYAEKSKKSKNKQFALAISIIDFSKDEPFSGSTTNHFNTLPPSSSPVKTSDNLEEFVDELTLLKKDVHFQVYSIPLFEFDDNFTSSNVNPLFNKMVEDVENENSNVSDSDEPVLLNTPLTDKVECFAPEDDIDEIDAFLAMEVSSNFKEVIFDHEPNESIHNTSITFSLRSDPLHHEFAGELLTLPSRIVREHEDYLNRITLLCEILISRSQENVHANQSLIIESLPVSPIPVEDSEPVQEEIDIFLVLDDLIPPGVENDDSEDEDNELPNLDHQDNPSSPRPPPKPPDVKKCLEPEAGILITKVFKGISKPHDFMADILPTLPTLVSDLTFILFLSSFLSFGSEDTIFYPGIITFLFSYLKPVTFSMEVSCSECCSP